MKKILILLLFICISDNYILLANEELNCCGTALQNTNGTGGIYLPSTGSINTLIIFAQFQDDQYDTGNSLWEKGKAPANMRKYVDSVWSTNPSQGSLTHYFNTMSNNNLHFTGKTVSVVTSKTRDWYLSNQWKRREICKDILDSLDQTWDFAEFDNWDFNGEYDHVNTSDSTVDMIIFVWRNIADDRQDPSGDETELNFTSSFGHLGVGTSDTTKLFVDNGARVIRFGWGIDSNYPTIIRGSGVCVKEFLNSTPFKNTVHEFAHYLLGDNNSHSGFGFWGMLSAWGSKSYAANSWERYKLKWMNDTTAYTITDSPNRTLSSQTLGDYLQTGHSYRYVIDKANDKYIYIENHQRTNYWENTIPPWDETGEFKNIETGIYVIRRDGSKSQFNTSAWLQCVPADGRYLWEVNQLYVNPWGSGELPVFKNLGPNRPSGFHDLERIPYSYGGQTDSDVIHITEDDAGNPQVDVRFHGDGRDAFRLDYNEVFSPYSNPNNQKRDRDTTNFGFYIKSESNGVYTLDLYIGTSEEAPPSKPQGLSVANSAQITGSFGTYTYSAQSHLSWIANTETDFDKYRIYKATTTSTAPGLNDYILIDSTTSTSKNIDINDFGDNRKIYYRITAVDTDGKESVLSESNWDWAPPSKPGGLSKSVVDGHPKISWDAKNFTDGTPRYDIYRKVPNIISLWSLLKQNHDTNYYIDTDYSSYTTGHEKDYINYKIVAKRRYDDQHFICSQFSDVINVPVNWYPQEWKKPSKDEGLPEVYAIGQNYPNPFNPTTRIKYQLPKNSFVTISIYDMLGREVAILVNEEQEAGYYEFSFDGSKLSSGTYIYKITAGDFTDSKKLLLVK